jgi:hypothetical protein
LPFGEGKKLFNVSNKFLNRIVSGWQTNLILTIESGRPWDLNPGGDREGDNIAWINPDAYIKDIQWKGVDQAWALRTYPNKTNPAVRSVCAARVGDSGALELLDFSKDLVGCTANNVDVIRKGQFGAARYLSYRDSNVRLHSPPIADLSFAKLTKITERMSLQFRVEMFNVMNTFSYRATQFNRNPDSANFGSIILRDAGNTDVAYPRHIQLAAKFIF